MKYLLILLLFTGCKASGQTKIYLDTSKQSQGIVSFTSVKCKTCTELQPFVCCDGKLLVNKQDGQHHNILDSAVQDPFGTRARQDSIFRHNRDSLLNNFYYDNKTRILRRDSSITHTNAIVDTVRWYGAPADTFWQRSHGRTKQMNNKHKQ